MRGEYSYLAGIREFARERFSVAEKDDYGLVIRSKVSGPDIGLDMVMEMHCLPDGLPKQLALSCNYRGMKGTASYDFTSNRIDAVVRSGGVERHLRAQLTHSCIVIPHPIIAYRQFARLAVGNESLVTACWIDVYNENDFLRPRLRQVTAVSSAFAGTQSVPAGHFADLTRICVSDKSSSYAMTGEGYLEQHGFPVLWRQEDGDTCYKLISLSD